MSRLNDPKAKAKAKAKTKPEAKPAKLDQLIQPRSNWDNEQPLWTALRKLIADSWTLYIYACSTAQRTLGDISPKKTEQGISEKILASVNAAAKRKGRNPKKETVQKAALILTAHNSLPRLNQLLETLPDSKPKQGAVIATQRAIKLRNKMLERNQPLVLHTVNLIRKNEDCGDLDNDDLAQHGYTGLVVAIERFEPERGFRFSTFANWWIFQSIRAAVKKEGRTIRLPHNVLTNMRMANREMSREITEKGKSCLEKTGKRLGLRPTETDQIRIAQRQTTLKRLDAPARKKDNSDGGSTVADCIGCAPQHDEKLDTVRLHEILRHEVRNLQVPNAKPEIVQRMRDILARRYGFGQEQQSLADIGRVYNVSRERIRQIETKAMTHLVKQLQKHKGVLEAMGYRLDGIPKTRRRG